MRLTILLNSKMATHQVPQSIAILLSFHAVLHRKLVISNHQDDNDYKTEQRHASIDFENM